MILGAPAAVSRHARDAVVEALGPDRCRVATGSWSWAGLAGTPGRFDAGIEVVGPSEPGDAFARLALRCARAATGAPAASPAHR